MKNGAAESEVWRIYHRILCGLHISESIMAVMLKRIVRLFFLAQFNCAEIVRFDTEHLLPDHGLLSFFASMIFVPRQTADAFIGLRTLRCCLQQIILRI